MIIGGSGSGKTNTLINLISEQDNRDVIDKIYLYAKDLNEPKYQFLIKKHEYVKNDPTANFECLNTMDDVYEIIKITTQKEIEKFWLFLMTWLKILWQIKNFRP